MCILCLSRGGNSALVLSLGISHILCVCDVMSVVKEKVTCPLPGMSVEGLKENQDINYHLWGIFCFPETA